MDGRDSAWTTGRAAGQNADPFPGDPKPRTEGIELSSAAPGEMVPGLTVPGTVFREVWFEDQDLSRLAPPKSRFL